MAKKSYSKVDILLQHMSIAGGVLDSSLKHSITGSLEFPDAKCVSNAVYSASKQGLIRKDADGCWHITDDGYARTLGLGGLNAKNEVGSLKAEVSRLKTELAVANAIYAQVHQKLADKSNECYELSKENTSLKQELEMLADENAALEAKLKNTRTASGGLEETIGAVAKTIAEVASTISSIACR